MSKKPTPQTTLILSCSDRGGDGKTTCLALIADYLATTGRTFGPIDCDSGNCDTPAGFSHWFPDPIARLDLLDVDDCDSLLEHSSKSGVEFVLADLPANTSTSLTGWIEETVTPEVLAGFGLRIIAMLPVDQSSGAPESAAAWMAALAGRAEFLVMLNRKGFEHRPKALEKTFGAWYHWLSATEGAQTHRTVEIPYLHHTTMDVLIGLQALPHRALKMPALPLQYRGRVESWSKRVHAQLNATGLFEPAESAAKAA